MKMDNRIFLAVTTALMAAGTPASAAVDVSTERTTMPAICSERDVVCLLPDGQRAPPVAAPVVPGATTIITSPVGSTATPPTAPAIGVPGASQVPSSVPSTTQVPASGPSTSQVPSTVPSTTTGSSSPTTSGGSPLGSGASTGLGASGTSSGGLSSGR
jgi:hypothetical protein